MKGFRLKHIGGNQRWPASIILVLLVVGCIHSKQITETSVLPIANRAVEQKGYHLADFEPAHVAAHQNHDWLVSYQVRTPVANSNGMVELKFGNYLYVFVDDRTGESRLKTGD